MAIDRYESTFVVDINGNGDFTSLQPAINALPSAGGKIFVKAGVYSIASTIQITASNVHIQGEGMGITVFTGDGAMTGNTPALDIHNSAVGVARAVVTDTALGGITLKVSPADAASFNPGDYILLYSNKGVDTEYPGKNAGEIKQVTAIDPIGGVITVDDQIFDTYTVGDSANVIQVTSYIHHINDVTPPSNEHYGISVGSASQNVNISGCRFFAHATRGNNGR